MIAMCNLGFVSSETIIQNFMVMRILQHAHTGIQIKYILITTINVLDAFLRTSHTCRVCVYVFVQWLNEMVIDRIKLAVDMRNIYDNN